MCKLYIKEQLENSIEKEILIVWIIEEINTYITAIYNIEDNSEKALERINNYLAYAKFEDKIADYVFIDDIIFVKDNFGETHKYKLK